MRTGIVATSVPRQYGLYLSPQDPRRASTLQTAISSRHVIGMAQGIAMERYGIDQHQSFELLRRLSSTTNVKLRDVATQIVETRAIPHERAAEAVDD